MGQNYGRKILSKNIYIKGNHLALAVSTPVGTPLSISESLGTSQALAPNSNFLLMQNLEEGSGGLSHLNPDTQMRT